MSVVVTCDLDGSTDNVLRYTLTHKERDEAGVIHSRSHGGVDLCRACWERICKPRMKAFSPDWHQAGDSRCDSCHRHKQSTTRYSVKKSIRDGKRVIDMAGGGLSLCKPCWLASAEPRMQARARAALLQRMELEERAKYTLKTGGAHEVGHRRTKR